VVRSGGKFRDLSLHKYLSMDILEIKTHQEVGVIYTGACLCWDGLGDWTFSGKNG
jgi:hypothetical protein